MLLKQKNIIIELAKATEEKRKLENLTSEETVRLFVEEIKQNGISLNGWFGLDDEIRKQHEIAGWFWMIRSVRNNIQKYA